MWGGGVTNLGIIMKSDWRRSPNLGKCHCAAAFDWFRSMKLGKWRRELRQNRRI